jgi:probable phosphoglycerate mutase
MTQPTTIHLIRHGDVHNPEQIMYGRLPNFRLSDKGQRQARGAAAAMAERPLAAIYSSPQQRAQETAGIIAEQHPGIEIHTEARIDEIHTPYDGTPLRKLATIGWDLYSNIDGDYEQPADIVARTQAFVWQVRRECAGREIVAVTHGDVVAFMIMIASGDTPEPGKKVSFTKYGLPEIYPNTASISSFTYQTDDVDEIPTFTYQRPY